MSASNWGICPDCQKRAQGMRDAFVKKYYGELDAFVYGKMLEEINEAVEHMAGYGSDEHKPNAEMLKLMEERNITVEYNGSERDTYELLCSGDVSSCLREDYGQGVSNKDGSMYFYYSCQCDCGFSKDVKYEENKHDIIKKVQK